MMDKQLRLLQKLIEASGKLDYPQFSPEFDDVIWNMDILGYVSIEQPKVDPGWSDLEDCWLEITDEGREYYEAQS